MIFLSTIDKLPDISIFSFCLLPNCIWTHHMCGVKIFKIFCLPEIFIPEIKMENILYNLTVEKKVKIEHVLSRS